MNVLAEKDEALETWRFAREAEGYRVELTARRFADAPYPQRWDAYHDTLPRRAFVACGDALSHELRVR